ncbi:hypothetical protein llap_5126 [Limosa lapponica baueri]|uniref:FZ domain-containing protein n=1 Tax=Limosa lapponica baueri TaxID=1758121 RepID=A0A2I0UEY2_LIMLA|nr:hypothetical protein llap_5126 [Limosa lapponica baueri]
MLPRLFDPAGRSRETTDESHFSALPMFFWVMLLCCDASAASATGLWKPCGGGDVVEPSCRDMQASLGGWVECPKALQASSISRSATQFPSFQEIVQMKKTTPKPKQLSVIFFPICIYKPGRKKFIAEQMESVQTNHYIC